MLGLMRSFIAAVALAAAAPGQAASLSYSLAFTDVGLPSSFAFVFGTPIVPQTGLSSWSFTGSIALVDATGDGVSASVDGLPEYWQLQVYDGSNYHLVDDIGGTSDLVGAGTYSFVASGTLDCSAVPGGCDFLILRLSGGMSGGNDQLTSTGTFTLTDATVPEPATLLLLGLGLAGLAIARRRTAA